MKKMLEIIRIKRREKNISQEYMATAVGLKTHAAYQRIEGGYVKLTVEMFMKIAEILEVSPHELIPDDGTFSKEQNKIAIQSQKAFIKDTQAANDSIIELAKTLIQQAEIKAENKENEIREMVSIIAKLNLENEQLKKELDHVKKTSKSSLIKPELATLIETSKTKHK